MASRKPVTKIPDFEIPFDKAGNQLAYPDYNTHEYRPNYTFSGYLSFENISRGRSAANFVLVDRTGKKYSMFMTDALHLLQNATVEGGQVYGRWTFCKRGANFGVTRYEGP